jgi:hypothetical protein
MDDKKLYANFLGREAENADIVDKLRLAALRAYARWRRTLHPETA